MYENRSQGFTITAYADLLGMVRDMWPVLLILCAGYILSIMAWFLAPNLIGTPLGQIVLRMLLFVGLAWLMSPYYIALHRYIATGERRWIPPRDGYGLAGQSYFSWAAMTVILWFMPPIVGDAIAAFLPLDGAVVVLGYTALVGLLARMTTLLPAAALAPHDADWDRAVAGSRGRGWSYFADTTGPVFPVIVALLVLGHAAAARSILPIPFFMLALPALLALQLIPLATGTRLYLRTRTLPR